MAPGLLVDQGAEWKQTVMMSKKPALATGPTKVGPSPEAPLMGMPSAPLAPAAACTNPAELRPACVTGHEGVPGMFVLVKVVGVETVVTAPVEAMARTK